MKRNINGLLGYTMKGIDGEIGKVRDFYFDDETWDIRHVILKTGNWFSGRDVLISPKAILEMNWKDGILPVNLTMKQMLESPEIDTNKPVSRQQEIEIYGHNLWQPFWGNDFYTTGLGGIFGSSNQNIQSDIKETAEVKPLGVNSSPDNRHLRSTHVVTGFHIHAIDGKIGHVIDFIIDDLNWKILYLAIDTHQWIGGQKLLLPVRNIKEIEWENATVYVDEKIETINKSLLFDRSLYEAPEPANVVTYNMNSTLE